MCFNVYSTYTVGYKQQSLLFISFALLLLIYYFFVTGARGQIDDSVRVSVQDNV